VAAGDQAGDIGLSRHLRIVGRGTSTNLEGTVTNAGAFELRLEDLAISPAAGRAVFTDDPCASTHLVNVFVAGALGYGVHARGGALEVRNAVIGATAAEPDPPTRGSGILVSCGAQAVLDDVSLTLNQAAGLVATDEGTLVDATDLLVSHNGVNPELAADPCAAPALFGAVQVHFGARLVGRFVELRGNDFAGLLVSGEGSEVELGYSEIATTRALEGVECAGGNNLVAIDGGHAVLEDFTLRDGDFAGVVLAREGEADLSGSCLHEVPAEDGDGFECDVWSSEVRSNRIGASVQTRGFDVGRLQGGVAYVDNVRTLEAAELPLPEPVGGIGD
jgi:hypothetical protein